ncbi:MAG TPA: response regulator [Pseudomonadales bacterium]|nr:response regulator [Pseudomonadales bacterium]
MAAIKFLVIDDAAFIRDLIKKALRDNFPGSTVHDSNSAKRAMAMTKALRYDIVLSDWEMPEMSGEEFLRWLREQENYVSTPFIMVSSRSEKEYIVKAIHAGVSDYIGKPFTAEELVAKINKQLKKIGHSGRSVDRTETSSLGALTGAAIAPKSTNNAPSPDTPAPVSDTVSALTGGAPQAAKPVTKKTEQAQLQFSGGQVLCLVQEMSLQAMSGLIKRDTTMPAIMEQCVVSIVGSDQEQVARLNAYVFSLRAADQRAECTAIKITLRFVDDDPQKLDILSRYIAKR